MKDEEYRLFQLYLMNNPEKGDIIKGSGGVRKIRWAINNKGKSGGIRVIYYWKDRASETWLLTLYAKNEKDSIPAHILKESLINLPKISIITSTPIDSFE